MVKRKSRPQIPKLSEAMKIVAGKKILLAAMLVRVQVPPGVQMSKKKVLQNYSVNTFFCSSETFGYQWSALIISFWRNFVRNAFVSAVV